MNKSIKIIIGSALACIPLVGIGMYLDFDVFNNHPFMNIGKWLGVVAIGQLITCGILGNIIENRTTKVTDSSTTKDRNCLT